MAIASPCELLFRSVCSNANAVGASLVSGVVERSPAAAAAGRQLSLLVAELMLSLAYDCNGCFCKGSLWRLRNMLEAVFGIVSSGNK